MQRRQFLATGLSTTCAALLPVEHACALSAAERRRLAGRGPSLLEGPADSLTLTDADRSVLAFVRTFANAIYMTGGCVAGKSGRARYRVTHLLARITSPGRYQEVVTRPGNIAGDGVAIGNTLCFNHLQATFELECLTKEAFALRVGAIKSGVRATGEPVVHGHEALLYEPAGKQLRDPYRVVVGRQGVLKRVSRSKKFDDLLQGILDTSAYNMVPDAQEQAELNEQLARRPARRTEAVHAAAAFLQSLSFAAQVTSASQIASYLSSPLLRSAFSQVFGFEPLRVVRSFARNRARHPATITDGVIWHALLSAADARLPGRPQVGTTALGGNSRLKTYLTMQEYQQVGVVLLDKRFRVYA